MMYYQIKNIVSMTSLWETFRLSDATLLMSIHFFSRFLIDILLTRVGNLMFTAQGLDYGTVMMKKCRKVDEALRENHLLATKLSRADGRASQTLFVFCTHFFFNFSIMTTTGTTNKFRIIFQRHRMFSYYIFIFHMWPYNI